MPWIDKKKCIGCEICVKQCPANAISIKGKTAEIDMDKCIRCGKCHNICPQKAVRHDSEKIPQEVEIHLEKTKALMTKFEMKEDKKDFLKRMIKYFNKEKAVAEKTIEKIKILIKNI